MHYLTKRKSGDHGSERSVKITFRLCRDHKHFPCPAFYKKKTFIILTLSSHGKIINLFPSHCRQTQHSLFHQIPALFQKDIKRKNFKEAISIPQNIYKNKFLYSETKAIYSLHAISVNFKRIV